MWDLGALFGWQKPAAGAKGMAALGGLGRRAALGAGGLGALLSAAGEFGDQEDSNAGNLADAAGMGLGTLAGGAAVLAPAALAGGPIGIGTLVLGSLAAALGGQLGKGGVRGLTDAVGITSTPDPAAKALDNALKARKSEIAMKALEAQTMLPYQYAAQQQDLAIQRQAAAAQQELAMAQNYQNAMLMHVLGAGGRVQDSLGQALGG